MKCAMLQKEHKCLSPSVSAMCGYIHTTVCNAWSFTTDLYNYHLKLQRYSLRLPTEGWLG